MEHPDDIWRGDLLSRRPEAEDLIGYLESVAARPQLREDGHAHVLAVDGQYGEGKTFFLRRLARHMAIEHPVAFVDAWVDDLQDEPLVALAATLQVALEPYLNQDEELRKRHRRFTRTAGNVAKIAGIGLLKRGVGLLITQTAVDALGNELTTGTEPEKKISQDAVKSGGQGLVNDSVTGLEASPSNMDERIARFREGKQATEEMRASLSDLVSRLTEMGVKTPVTIVVDELDRCRPTYAIKFLEEVKHLFDVPGVAFVLGLHSGQLRHSISATYGDRFDAASYLRRFFSRRYALAPASLDPLISLLIDRLTIPVKALAYPLIRIGEGRAQPVKVEKLIADYMRAFDLSARDAFPIMEALETACALTTPHIVYLPYLLPLLIRQHTQQDAFPEALSLPWVYEVEGARREREPVQVNAMALLKQLSNAATQSNDRLVEALNNGGSYALRVAAENRFGDARVETSSYASLRNYPELARVVKRFRTDQPGSAA
jgi:hypothetical protein